MRKNSCLFLLLLFSVFNSLYAQQPDFWWKKNNLRVIQTNLPDYEAATLDPDSLVKDLIAFSANTLIINAGGIMAFYPTKLDFHYINPYMKPGTLGNVIKKCHENGIKVIVRVDFSRVHESIFKAHPDWCYTSPKGERMINSDMYVVSINAPYVQDKAFRIIEEIMDLYPVDGIFLNMPGYQVRNAYEDKYQGIDQNDFDRKRFAAFSNGMELPKEENPADPAYQRYLDFKKFTVDKWSEELHRIVKARNPQTAICTYMDKFVDIIRHESQSNTTLPYWPYNASDNVGNAGNSYPDHIICNGSIQQISFQSRYNAVEPAEVQIRLYENIANGSGLDLSMMGDTRGYEDERNYEVFKKIYAHHKKFEPYYGRYKSGARIAVVSPGSWVHGESGQEYRGIQLMLKEAHIPFDIVEYTQIANLADKIKQYKLLVLPEITMLDSASRRTLTEAVAGGTHLIATNRSLAAYPEMLESLFGAKVSKADYDGAGNYLVPDNKAVFKRFEKQKMISWKFNLGMYDLSGADERFLPILSKGRPGPPEIIGGHEPVGFYAMGVKNHPRSKAVILPMNLGRLYYMHGYQQDKNILLDVIDYIFPSAAGMLQTNAPARVEVILQQYIRNTPENADKKEQEGMILHLINLTGFSNTYFDPLPVRDLTFDLASDFRPSRVTGMTGKQPVRFKWENNRLKIILSQLEAYEGIIISK